MQQAREKLEQLQDQLDKAMRQLEKEKALAGDATPAPDGKGSTQESAAKAPGDDDAAQAEKPVKPPGTARGLETLFRSAYRVQMDLTGLADNKANIMISINGIIMSIIIASVAPKLDSNPWLLLPTTVVLVGSMISMTYAILAARPRVSTDPITLNDLRHSKGNILFFGNFANLSEDDFVSGIDNMMWDKPLVYETMMRNIHGIGTVLNKKYALLQYAYTSFMIALLLGVSSFIGVFFWVLLYKP